MKKAKRLLLFVALFTGLTFVSCSDEEDNVSVWVCNIGEDTTITMKLNEEEKKFYTIVDGKSYLRDKQWYEYNSGGYWNIEKKSFDTLLLEYSGLLNGTHIARYEFKRVY
ncbi:MAG: hypothetical protein IJ180_00960 [Bacteroidales bacterium]|nr:hypothetical protein [Bacteroidales bacterium]